MFFGYGQSVFNLSVNGVSFHARIKVDVLVSSY